MSYLLLIYYTIKFSSTDDKVPSFLLFLEVIFPYNQSCSDARGMPNF